MARPRFRAFYRNLLCKTESRVVEEITDGNHLRMWTKSNRTSKHFKTVVLRLMQAERLLQEGRSRPASAGGQSVNVTFHRTALVANTAYAGGTQGPLPTGRLYPSTAIVLDAMGNKTTYPAAGYASLQQLDGPTRLTLSPQGTIVVDFRSSHLTHAAVWY